MVPAAPARPQSGSAARPLLKRLCRVRAGPRARLHRVGAFLVRALLVGPAPLGALLLHGVLVRRVLLDGGVLVRGPRRLVGRRPRAGRRTLAGRFGERIPLGVGDRRPRERRRGWFSRWRGGGSVR